MNDTSTATIVKNDRSGRTRYPADFKLEALAAFDRSSLSALAFAEQHGIKYPTFTSWLTKRRKQQTQSAKDSSPFILAEIGAASSSPEGLRVELPGGATAIATTAEATTLVAQLIKALA